MAVQIPCPQCGAVLKLRDRSMLGRSGKCPKCGHHFVLIEPDEVALELAEPSPETPIPVAKARRVTEGASPSAASVGTAEPVASEFPSFGEAVPPPSGTKRLRDLKRKQTKQRRIGIIAGGLLAAAVVGATWAGLSYSRSQPRTDHNRPEPPKQDAVYLSERERLERTAQLIAADSPTKGEPITLRYVPAGAAIVVHLRPAELWKRGSVGEEIRYCLGEDFQRWSETLLPEYCLLPPAEIEEATICLILGARGSEPQIAAVVRPVEPRKTSELIQMFDGSPQDIEGVQVYVGSERAAVIGTELDEQKRPLLFATAPADLAEDLARSVTADGITSDAVRELLTHTDRERHLTFVFQTADLRIHDETLVTSDLRPAWGEMLDRLGEDAEAAAWSVHLTGDDFYSELLLRNDPATTPAQLLEGMTRRFDKLPPELVAAVSKMNPAEVGDRKLIGRFPAMLQLFAAATVGGIDDRLVVLQTRLPERAGPNLALAGLLAWNESTRTDFTKPADGSPATPEVGAATLTERLKKPVEIDFRRTPLEEAFAYIGGETGVEFEIDGDALKLSAYTRNMPQTISLGTVPAEKGVAAILAQYDKMAVVLDEANGKAIVTTKPAAEEKGLTPATFAP